MIQRAHGFGLVKHPRAPEHHSSTEELERAHVYCIFPTCVHRREVGGALKTFVSRHCSQCRFHSPLATYAAGYTEMSLGDPPLSPTPRNCASVAIHFVLNELSGGNLKLGAEENGSNLPSF